ncbi:glycoside hydrolase family 125 protein [Paenibacillus thermotolerans]|uniref:glycoside hydrolase family 125 protein n=1 Tax=Paenibacillus thermotolerans TaxID=3027807 RepID=UPI00236890E2|nr:MULTISPECIES: glycoside hydrolase family 125 protein [unclassified Paenibacillus]
MEPPAALQPLIDDVKIRLQARHEKAAQIFETCIRNTLETTIRRDEDGSTFVITGDIPAMWLRDSAAQVRPYLLLASEDREIANMIKGLIERQFRYILHDPYANAFNSEDNGRGHQSDLTEMSPWIWERKYEIDSLCYPIQLSYLLWKNSGRTDQFDDMFVKGVQSIIALWKREQRHEEKSAYRFQRVNCPPTDTLPRDGKGALTAYTGMTWSGFRPSDDACTYGYLIPSNMFAVVVLRYVREIASELLHHSALADEAKALAAEIEAGINKYGIVAHPEFGPMYAYETDGMGNHVLMDDANVPSLLSLPYLDYCSPDDPVYVNTRRFILSDANPYYFKGVAAAGVGSPHTPNRYIWHIALAIQGLTATATEEKERILDLMTDTDAGKGMMHESFDQDDPSKYTREWFSWANMMFCELALDVCGKKVKV